MSNNYLLYPAKIAEKRTRLHCSAVLRRQLDELFKVVGRCEAMWALEDRIERQR